MFMIKNMLIEAIDTLLMSHTKPKLRIFSERLATICERKDADAFFICGVVLWFHGTFFELYTNEFIYTIIQIEW